MANHESTIDRLHGEMPGVMDAFTKLHDEVLKEGAVSAKYKRLMLIAIAVALRCDHCLRRHMEGAVSKGATREETIETAAVGMLMAGGPAVAFTSTHVVELLKDFGMGG